MREITFNCCKFLNHTKGQYIECTLKEYKGAFAYWERGEIWTDGGRSPRSPRDVQFCSRRGRLNFKTACIEGGGECSDYINEERTIEIEDSLTLAELDGEGER